MKTIKNIENRISHWWYMQPEEHREAYLFLFMCFVLASLLVVTLFTGISLAKEMS